MSFCPLQLQTASSNESTCSCRYVCGSIYKRSARRSSSTLDVSKLCCRLRTAVMRCRIQLYCTVLFLLLCRFEARSLRRGRSHVCIVTCDFWGLPNAGGTATAYHLLASTLADAGPRVWPVTFLAATQQPLLCQRLQQNSLGSTFFECLQPEHFLPQVVDNFPYEALGVAVVRWLQTAGQKCEVVHTHEWYV